MAYHEHIVTSIDEQTDNRDARLAPPATASPSAGDTATDGRSLRRLRNREHVLQTVLTLIRNGDSSPSVQDVADGAGVSLRSIFRYFDDLDDLVRAAIELGVQQSKPLGIVPNAGEGPLELRIDTFVDSRLRLYASTHAFGRVARNRSDSIPALGAAVQQVYELLRVQARAQFEPELTRLDPVDAEFMLDSICLVTGFGSYDTERVVLGHSVERIRVVWKRNLTPLLTSVG